jgi:two-component system phosphate regulon sensor histidine kinase PhoR
MGQVLVGVIHNAVKFTPPGGTIVVRVAQDATGVRLSVMDNGVGLDADEVPRIFERFYKASQRSPDRHQASAWPAGGTGLGLAIAKHTVQLHGGAIWAESDGPGRGTTIHVSLPPTRAERPDASSASPTGAPVQ